MAVMWRIPRVSKCCCGCSLKTGTLILLFLGLLNYSSSLLGDISALGSGDSVLITLLRLALNVIAVVIISSALFGAITHRSSLMIPFLTLTAIGLVLITLVFVLAMISLPWSDKIFNSMFNQTAHHFEPKKNATIEKAPKENATIEKAPETNATIEKAPETNATIEKTPAEKAPEEKPSEKKDSLQLSPQTLFFISSITWVLEICLGYYFLCVIYSYYKEIQVPTTGPINRDTRVVYSVPKSYSSACGPQPVAALCPQGLADHPTRFIPNL